MLKTGFLLFSFLVLGTTLSNGQDLADVAKATSDPQGVVVTFKVDLLSNIVDTLQKHAAERLAKSRQNFLEFNAHLIETSKDRLKSAPEIFKKFWERRIERLEKIRAWMLKRWGMEDNRKEEEKPVEEKKEENVTEDAKNNAKTVENQTDKPEANVEENNAEQVKENENSNDNPEPLAQNNDENKVENDSKVDVPVNTPEESNIQSAPVENNAESAPEENKAPVSENNKESSDVDDRSFNQEKIAVNTPNERFEVDSKVNIDPNEEPIESDKASPQEHVNGENLEKGEDKQTSDVNDVPQQENNSDASEEEEAVAPKKDNEESVDENKVSENNPISEVNDVPQQEDKKDASEEEEVSALKKDNEESVEENKVSEQDNEAENDSQVNATTEGIDYVANFDQNEQ